MDKNKELSAFQKAALKANEDLSGFQDAYKLAEYMRSTRDIPEDKMTKPIAADKAKELVKAKIAASMSDVWDSIYEACEENRTFVTTELTDGEIWVLIQMGYDIEYIRVTGKHTITWA